ncbi:MAG: DEAD/DEAH box helicase family protein [Acidimicrobiales bacterium]|nr:DEAD/DEAH box helicase family protein [Acidimicrobiales bacterium]
MSVFSDIDPGHWIASNELAFAVRDLHPVTDGHSLVIPRRIIGTWWEATPDEKLAIFDLVEEIKLALDESHSPDGYNVGFNAGDAAGQTVGHAHVHVIPRYRGDVEDPRGGVRHVIPALGNYLAPSAAAEGKASASLVTPLSGRLRRKLVRCLVEDDFDRIDLAVSFVMRSGLNLIARHIDEALERGAVIRLLTTDYGLITDASALGFFLDRVDQSAPGSLTARVFSDPTTSFHPKAYLFSSSTSGAGVAFVGSSNLSHSGLTTGVEWNLETRHLTALQREFETLWLDSRSIELTSAWLDQYDEARRQRAAAEHQFVVEAEDHSAGTTDREAGATADEVVVAPKPWSVQADALAALESTRIEGHGAGLVVMATGLGKTWLAAFDSTRPEFRRVLFVAHRAEILTQARDVYRQVRPGGSLTLFTGGERDPGGDVVFASVQSLHRNLGEFDPAQFDYLVVDEFHHAAASTYRRVLAHFEPRFLLGLTATPDRADAADLLALCSDNLVYDCGLVEGVTRGLLCAFEYHAIADVADYEHIPWHNGRFDTEELTTQLATVRRAEQVVDEWRRHGGSSRRALGFCCTVAHADFMAEHFRSRGVDAVAVHSGTDSAPRAESLERLVDGDLDVIFTVDLFNEGVDLPNVDLVLLLRPTESPVVFFQQLGRGLRRSQGKEKLVAVDLVGNHRSFLLKARLLAGLAGRTHITDREAVAYLRSERSDLAGGSTDLPEGCSIIIAPEVVDLLTRLAGRETENDRLLALARQWANDHEGRRPTALELSLVHGRAFNLKKATGGWFGFLERFGFLAPEETAVVNEAGEYLAHVEHDNYTKSYKLVTLAILARSGRITSGMSLTELAVACRWEVLRDPTLRADLADATGSFGNIDKPTDAEWQRYWRKNPINALTTPSRGADPWFVVEDDIIRFGLQVPDVSIAVFQDLLLEIVEYRLHRYLAQKEARRVGEVRNFSRDGVKLNTTFVVESLDGQQSSGG